MRRPVRQRKRCPFCGGRIIVKERFLFDKLYLLKQKDGIVSQVQHGQTEPVTAEYETACCESCEASWGPRDFFIDQAGKFWDLKYGS